MKKYIITIRGEKDYTAASKARADAQAIAEAGGYVPFPFEGERSAKGSALAAAEGLFVWQPPQAPHAEG